MVYEIYGLHTAITKQREVRVNNRNMVQDANLVDALIGYCEPKDWLVCIEVSLIPILTTHTYRLQPGYLLTISSIDGNGRVSETFANVCMRAYRTPGRGNEECESIEITINGLIAGDYEIDSIVDIQIKKDLEATQYDSRGELIDEKTMAISISRQSPIKLVEE